MSTGEQLHFDVTDVRPGGLHEILEGLLLDREHVVGLDHDPATGQLVVRLIDASAAEHVSAFVHSMKRTHRLIAPKVLTEHRVGDLTVHDIDTQLANSEFVQVLGEGLTGLRGPLLRAFRFFERWFRDLADEFEADENHYPVMVPKEILEEVGYFEHFPQHVTMCSHLPDNLPLLESVAASVSEGGGASAIAAQLCEPSHVLTPGVCIPCYRQQRDQVLGANEVRTLTMHNHVFRYEGVGFRPLTRAWDFTVRDIVFFSDYERLKDLRVQVIERCMDLCRELDLEVTIELAHDPFFLDASRDKAIYQHMGEVKYELLFELPHRGRPLAASSFNLHRDFYTSVYNTRGADGELVESACMGFGMERRLYGFLSQKGLDPAGWPEQVSSFAQR